MRPLVDGSLTGDGGSGRGLCSFLPDPSRLCLNLPEGRPRNDTHRGHPSCCDVTMKTSRGTHNAEGVIRGVLIGAGRAFRSRGGQRV